MPLPTSLRNLAHAPILPASWRTSLYALCERKKRAAEAMAYNGLVQSWPEMLNLAHAQQRDTLVQV